MQTANDDEARNLTKAEYQAFHALYVLPLLRRKLKRRLERENGMENVPVYPTSYAEHPEDPQKEQITGHASLQQISDYHTAQLEGSFAGLMHKAWDRAPGTQFHHYEPTTIAHPGEPPPYLTEDNAGSYSLWEGNLKEQAKSTHKLVQDIGMPLLQRITVPPKGHDAHQIVEHGIGTTKGHANRGMCTAVRNGEALTLGMLYDLLLEGGRLFTATAVLHNIARLRACMRVVSAQTDEVVKFEHEVRRTLKEGTHWEVRSEFAQGTAGGFPPATIA